MTLRREDARAGARSGALSGGRSARYSPAMPPGSARRVTSRDVAAHAGVSQATVSLVFSGAPPSRVGAATRERVFASSEMIRQEATSDVKRANRPARTVE